MYQCIPLHSFHICYSPECVCCLGPLIEMVDLILYWRAMNNYERLTNLMSVHIGASVHLPSFLLNKLYCNYVHMRSLQCLLSTDV